MVSIFELLVRLGIGEEEPVLVDLLPASKTQAIPPSLQRLNAPVDQSSMSKPSNCLSKNLSHLHGWASGPSHLALLRRQNSQARADLLIVGRDW